MPSETSEPREFGHQPDERNGGTHSLVTEVARAIPALTLHQPWASLVSLRAKTIETRGWTTKYRGPLAITAAAGIPSYLGLGRRGRLTVGDYEVEKDASGLLLRGPVAWPYRLPMGAVVATVDLVDVLPIHSWGCDCDHGEGIYALVSPTSFGPNDIVGLFHAPTGNGVRHARWSPSSLDCLDPQHPRQQAPYGDYRCGRFAWLLDDVRPVLPPEPFKGGQGLSRKWVMDKVVAGV